MKRIITIVAALVLAAGLTGRMDEKYTNVIILWYTNMAGLTPTQCVFNPAGALRLAK